MTVASNEFYTDWLLADGENVDWSYDFTIFSATHVVIQVRTGVDNSTVQEFTSGFSFRPSTDFSSGYISYPSSGDPILSGQQVRIVREVPFTQNIEIGNEGDFSPIIHERAFDLLTMQTQQLNNGLARSVKVPLGYLGYKIAPDIQAGYTLMMTSSGIAQGPNGADIAGAQGYAAAAAISASQAIGIVGDLGTLADAVDSATASAAAAAQSAIDAAGAVSGFVLGGYGVFLPETRDWLKAISDGGMTEPSRRMAFAYDDLIDELKVGGLWSLQKLLYIGSYNQIVAGINLVAPTVVADRLTAQAGGGFLAGGGFSLDGVAGFYKTTTNLNTVMLQDDAAMFSFALEGTTRDDNANVGNGYTVDAVLGASYIVACRASATKMRTRLNDLTSSDSTENISDGLGLSLTSRLSSAGYNQYRDGAVLGSPAVVSTGLPNGSFYLGHGSTTGYTDGVYPLLGVSRGLTQSQVISFNSAIRTFLTQVGII